MHPQHGQHPGLSSLHGPLTQSPSQPLGAFPTSSASWALQHLQHHHRPGLLSMANIISIQSFIHSIPVFAASPISSESRALQHLRHIHCPGLCSIPDTIHVWAPQLPSLAAFPKPSVSQVSEHPQRCQHPEIQSTLTFQHPHPHQRPWLCSILDTFSIQGFATSPTVTPSWLPIISNPLHSHLPGLHISGFSAFPTLPTSRAS